MERFLTHRTGRLALGAGPLVMGIVNVTPDSFSDGGLNLRPEVAVGAARAMAEAGADILDIGAESSRPGHAPIDAEEEWHRLAPVLDGLLGTETLPPVSVDTSKAVVARKALAGGASLINDVWGFRRDPDIAGVAAENGAAAILMHNRDTVDPTIDIVEEILRFLERSIGIARRAGLSDDRIVVDPGLGFGKNHAQSYQALAALPRLRALGFPILIGLSRKRFVGAFGDPARTPAERRTGTLAANVYAALGGADIIRVHEVPEHVEALRVLSALRAAA